MNELELRRLAAKSKAKFKKDLAKNCKTDLNTAALIEIAYQLKGIKSVLIKRRE